MNFAEEDCCRGGSAVLIGIDCTCGHHFHIGPERLFVEAPIQCPRCDVTGMPDGEPPKPATAMSEQEVIDACCGDVPAPVAKGVRAVAASRRNPDPMFWANVVLRESWRHEHGSYEGWDQAALAGGVDGSQFGPA